MAQYKRTTSGSEAKPEGPSCISGKTKAAAVTIMPCEGGIHQRASSDSQLASRAPMLLGAKQPPGAHSNDSSSNNKSSLHRTATDSQLILAAADTCITRSSRSGNLGSPMGRSSSPGAATATSSSYTTSSRLPPSSTTAARSGHAAVNGTLPVYRHSSTPSPAGPASPAATGGAKLSGSGGLKARPASRTELHLAAVAQRTLTAKEGRTAVAFGRAVSSARAPSSLSRSQTSLLTSGSTQCSPSSSTTTSLRKTLACATGRASWCGNMALPASRVTPAAAPTGAAAATAGTAQHTSHGPVPASLALAAHPESNADGKAPAAVQAAAARSAIHDRTPCTPAQEASRASWQAALDVECSERQELAASLSATRRQLVRCQQQLAERSSSHSAELMELQQRALHTEAQLQEAKQRVAMIEAMLSMRASALQLPPPFIDVVNNSLYEEGPCAPSCAEDAHAASCDADASILLCMHSPRASSSVQLLPLLSDGSERAGQLLRSASSTTQEPLTPSHSPRKASYISRRSEDEPGSAHSLCASDCGATGNVHRSFTTLHSNRLWQPDMQRDTDLHSTCWRSESCASQLCSAVTAAARPECTACAAAADAAATEDRLVLVTGTAAAHTDNVATGCCGAASMCASISTKAAAAPSTSRAAALAAVPDVGTIACEGAPSAQRSAPVCEAWPAAAEAAGPALSTASTAAAAVKHSSVQPGSPKDGTAVKTAAALGALPHVVACSTSAGHGASSSKMLVAAPTAVCGLEHVPAAAVGAPLLHECAPECMLPAAATGAAGLHGACLSLAVEEAIGIANDTFWGDDAAWDAAPALAALVGSSGTSPASAADEVAAACASACGSSGCSAVAHAAPTTAMATATGTAGVKADDDVSRGHDTRDDMGNQGGLCAACSCGSSGIIASRSDIGSRTSDEPNWNVTEVRRPQQMGSRVPHAPGRGAGGSSSSSSQPQQLFSIEALEWSWFCSLPGRSAK